MFEQEGKSNLKKYGLLTGMCKNNLKQVLFTRTRII